MVITMTAHQIDSPGIQARRTVVDSGKCRIIWTAERHPRRERNCAGRDGSSKCWMQVVVACHEDLRRNRNVRKGMWMGMEM